MNATRPMAILTLVSVLVQPTACASSQIVRLPQLNPPPSTKIYGVTLPDGRDVPFDRPGVVENGSVVVRDEHPGGAPEDEGVQRYALADLSYAWVADYATAELIGVTTIDGEEIEFQRPTTIRDGIIRAVAQTATVGRTPAYANREIPLSQVKSVWLGDEKVSTGRSLILLGGILVGVAIILFRDWGEGMFNDAGMSLACAFADCG